MVRNLKAYVVALLFLAPAMAGAGEIQVMSSNAMREAYRELVPQFEKQSGHRVVTSWVGSADIMKRMRAGETADLVILQASSIDELVQLGKVMPGSRVDLARSGIGVAVRAGAQKPDIGSGEALKRALLGAKSIVVSSGPSGIYLLSLFQRMGIADQLKPRLIQTAPGVQTGELVARGEAEIGFQQVSELLPVRGIDYLGPLPPDVQHVTVFSGGIHAAAKQPAAAGALIRFLASADAGSVLRKKGMQPAVQP
jgi:molybdate transport system substrate-binding protein